MDLWVGQALVFFLLFLHPEKQQTDADPYTESLHVFSVFLWCFLWGWMGGKEAEEPTERRAGREEKKTGARAIRFYRRTPAVAAIFFFFFTPSSIFSPQQHLLLDPQHRERESQNNNNNNEKKKSTQTQQTNARDKGQNVHHQLAKLMCTHLKRKI
jgi:hypothetical protein